MEEAVPVPSGGQRKQLLAAGAHGGPPVQATCTDTHTMRQKIIFLCEENIIHKDVVLTRGRAKQIGFFF